MSLAWIFMAPIWPALALLRTSACSFFSWFSSLTRSRSSSRCVFSSDRWCLRSRSAGVMRLPNAHSTRFMAAREGGLMCSAARRSARGKERSKHAVGCGRVTDGLVVSHISWMVLVVLASASHPEMEGRDD
jgi:hypothetical protein